MTPVKPYKFDNLIAQFVYQGRFMEENVAIKHVWQKGNGVFFDLYFYRTQTTKIIDTSYIRTLYDLSTDKGYTNMKKFVEEYFHNIDNPDDNDSHQESYELKEAEYIPPPSEISFDPFLPELMILKFLSDCTVSYRDVKLNAICDFIKNKHKEYNIDDIKSYINNLEVTEDDFYNNMKALSKKTPEEVVDLLHEAIKVSISDGGLSYNERVYLTELLQTAREHNIKFDF